MATKDEANHQSSSSTTSQSCHPHFPELSTHYRAMASLPSYPPAFKPYHPSVSSIFGSSPTLDLVLENENFPFAHEAGVFVPSQNALYITSNQFLHPTTREKHVMISRIDLPSDDDDDDDDDEMEGSSRKEVTCTEIHAPDIPMANGAVNYKNGILFCAQGTMERDGGIVYMPLDTPPTPYYSEQPPITPPPSPSTTSSAPAPPITRTALESPQTHTLISHFHSRPLNSPNDVVPHTATNTILFTDPPYGSTQNIRPPPCLPAQIYAYAPAHNSLRVVADGLAHPNGICLSPDERTCYISDTDWIHGDGSTDDTRVSTMYAFSVEIHHGSLFLVNKRVFAMADVGVPDGIKCDGEGNVYAGCGDGVAIWSRGGVLLGKVLVEGGVSNFCFGRGGVLWVLNETRIWRVGLRRGVRGALLGL